MTPVSKNNPQGEQPEASRSTRRERRSSKGRPGPAEVAAEAAAIYPDTFDTPPTPDEIAAEAYAIYQARGGEHGRHEDDWFGPASHQRSSSPAAPLVAYTSPADVRRDCIPCRRQMLVVVVRVRGAPGTSTRAPEHLRTRAPWE